MDEERPVIVTDTREKKAYIFKGSVQKALPAGDYSLAGHERRVAIERKKVEKKAISFQSVKAAQ